METTITKEILNGNHCIRVEEGSQLYDAISHYLVERGAPCSIIVPGDRPEEDDGDIILPLTSQQLNGIAPTILTCQRSDNSKLMVRAHGRLSLLPGDKPYVYDGITMEMKSLEHRDGFGTSWLSLQCPDREKLLHFLADRVRSIPVPDVGKNFLPIRERRGGYDEIVNYMYLNPDVMESLDEDTKTLLTTLTKKFDPSRAESLRRKGIEPRFNLLFTGIPGAGKTYLAAIIAKTLSRPIYKTDGDSLGRVVRDLREPAVVVVEDADANGARQRGSYGNCSDDGGIGNMLQMLDGTRLGHLFIFTTNYPDRLDVAVLRSERFSMKLMFGYASNAAKGYILRRYFGEYPDIEGRKAWKIVYKEIKNLELTNAQLTSFCGALHARDTMPMPKDYDALKVRAKEFATLWKCSLTGINVVTN